MAGQLLVHIGVMFANLNVPVVIHAALVTLAMPLDPPAVWVDELRERRPGLRLGESHARGLVLAGEGLIGMFKVVVVRIGLIDFTGGGQVSGASPLQTLLFQGAVIPLHERILIGPLRGADDRLGPHDPQEAQQGRREILARPTAHPARVAVDGNAFGTTMGAQDVGHCQERTLRRVICVDWTIHQGR